MSIGFGGYKIKSLLEIIDDTAAPQFEKESKMHRLLSFRCWSKICFVYHVIYLIVMKWITINKGPNMPGSKAIVLNSIGHTK